MPPGTLIIRADASVAMGTGHVMRCLALAQAWQDEGGECVFAMAESHPSLAVRVRSERIEIVDITATAGSRRDAEEALELAGRKHASWIVVDGYQFDIEYQKRLKAGGVKLLVIDDTGHAGGYVADVVLDQNAHANEKVYRRREPFTRLLLGSRYALLRREFKPWRAWKREITPIGRNVLVTMGGSDPQNHTALAIHALQRVQVDAFESRVVIGGSNPHFDGLQVAAGRGSRSICLVRNAANMPDLMAWADVAFAAAGSAAWELAFMGLPAIFTVSAEHQKPIAEAAQTEVVGVNFGGLTEASELRAANSIRDLLLDASRRETMAVNGRRLVDGVGAGRVVSILTGNGEAARNAQS